MRLFSTVLIVFCLADVETGACQQGEFPYKRNKKDIVLLPVGIGVALTSDYLGRKNYSNLSRDEIAALNRNDVIALDRNATYFWNRDADRVSNVIYAALPFTPISLALPQLKNKHWDNTLTLAVMYFEVALFNRSVTGLTKALTGRVRPYLYNTSLTIEERFQVQGNGAPTANTSFFSGHSSGTFAFAVLLSKTYTDIYGKGTWSTIIWATSLSLASVTAYCRVAAGEHFTTDVIAGAFVGSAIGYFIPELHKKNPEKLSLSILPDYFSIVYRF